MVVRSEGKKRISALWGLRELGELRELPVTTTETAPELKVVGSIPARRTSLTESRPLERAVLRFYIPLISKV